MSGAELAALRRTLLEVALREHQALGPALAAAREAFAWVAGDARQPAPPIDPPLSPPAAGEAATQDEQPTLQEEQQPERKPAAATPTSDLQVKLLAAVEAKPGIDVIDLALSLDSPVASVRRSCTALAKKGCLREAMGSGGLLLLYPVPAASAAPAPAAGVQASTVEAEPPLAEADAGGEQQDGPPPAEPAGAGQQREEQQDDGDRAQGAAEDEETPGDREDRVLAQVRAAPGSNINQLSDKLVLHPDTVRLILRTLERDDKVRSQPSAKGKLYSPVVSDEEAAAEAEAAERARQAKLRLPAGGVRAKIGG
jgi:hypothetical protein